MTNHSAFHGGIPGSAVGARKGPHSVAPSSRTQCLYPAVNHSTNSVQVEKYTFDLTPPRSARNRRVSGRALLGFGNPRLSSNSEPCTSDVEEHDVALRHTPTPLQRYQERN